MRSLLCVQGYYRRGDANVALSKFKLALRDLKMAAKVAPRDPDLLKKLLACEKEVKRIRFEEALATPVSPRPCAYTAWACGGLSSGLAQHVNPWLNCLDTKPPVASTDPCHLYRRQGSVKATGGFL